jgi:hypothetical protein
VNTSLEVAAVEQMKPLCGPLHSALQYGAEHADQMVRDAGLTDSEHNWHRHNHARVLAGARLAQSDELGPWKVLPRQKTGSLQLVNGFMTVRVLRPLDGKVPVPGLNKRRRAFYVQRTITGLPMDVAFPELQISNFVATWEVLDLETFEVGIKVFRTTGTFKIGDTSKVDLAFWLPNEADALDSLVFEPSDKGIELPIPKEESDVEPLRG